MIHLDNIHKTFTLQAKTVEALKGVSLGIHKGDIFGVIGQSGAGKSTLIRTINFLEIPDAGDIIVNGRNLKSLTEKELQLLRRRIGMIFQSFNLLKSRTVYDNIAFPLELDGWSKADIDVRVTELLELIGMTDKRTVYPAQLSGGQKQRVAIARAIANRPEILLCDEATSALDPETTQSILALLKDIHRVYDITIVLITHEYEVLKQICNRGALLKNGELIKKGSIEEVLCLA